MREESEKAAHCANSFPLFSNQLLFFVFCWYLHAHCIVKRRCLPRFLLPFPVSVTFSLLNFLFSIDTLLFPLEWTVFFSSGTACLFRNAMRSLSLDRNRWAHEPFFGGARMSPFFGALFVFVHSCVSSVSPVREPACAEAKLSRFHRECCFTVSSPVAVGGAIFSVVEVDFFSGVPRRCIWAR